MPATSRPKTGSRLVVDVSSDRRHYGRLMAVYPTTQSFFAQERELLEVYARYAAAVLDTATARSAAERQHEQARALLELSRAVAAAGTSEEVALRLAEAVPSVVDCDRTGVFVWDEAERVLCCKAAFGYPRADDERLRELRITTTDTIHLGRMLTEAQPGPLFFGQDTEDIFVRRLLDEFASAGVVVVPIAARGSFFGILTVAVVASPRRLEPTPQLLDRLAGVVAHAATALANGRLVDRMAQEARHDSLTGLLGHRALQETLQMATEGEGQRALQPGPCRHRRLQGGQRHARAPDGRRRALPRCGDASAERSRPGPRLPHGRRGVLRPDAGPGRRGRLRRRRAAARGRGRRAASTCRCA